jgi:hypothetical protein
METFKEILTLIGFSQYIQPAVTVFVLTLGMVYIFGRMLNIAKTAISKNRVAVVTIVISSILFTTDFFIKYMPEEIKHILFVIGSASILYTIIGMRLFVRVNNLQDKVIGDDNIVDVPEDINIVKKRKTKLK